MTIDNSIWGVQCREMKSPRAEIINEFNLVFQWSFPVDASHESLEAMKAYAAVRGRHDIAAKIETLLAAPVAGQPAGKLAIKHQDVPVGTDATGAVK